jgi:hypothetical protein
VNISGFDRLGSQILRESSTQGVESISIISFLQAQTQAEKTADQKNALFPAFKKVPFFKSSLYDGYHHNQFDLLEVSQWANSVLSYPAVTNRRL